MSGRLLGAQMIALALALVGLSAATAVAAPVEISMESFDAAGNPEVRAGAHPDRVELDFKFDAGEQEARDAFVDLPAGMSGDPSAVALCPAASIEIGEGKCPAASQVGTIPGSISLEPPVQPLYAVEPAPGQAIKFAAPGFFAPTVLAGHLRPDDLGLRLSFAGAPQSAILGEATVFEAKGGEVTLWGVPADHQEGTGIPRRALLTLPTACNGPPPPSVIRMRTWQQPERWLSGASDPGQPLVGCGDLGFQPHLGFALDESTVDAPSGARIDISVPQNDDAGGQASAQVRSLRLAMPEGMSVSPGGVDGRSACTDAQLGRGSASEPACPASSRVGTVELGAAALGKPSVGAIYLGEEHPGDRFRLFIVANAGGTEMKLTGSMGPDPVSGRLVATVDDLPQVSFDRFAMRFDGGPRALFTNPLECGPGTALATLTTYSGSAPANRSASAAVTAQPGRKCSDPPPFDPSLRVAASSGRGGTSTSFAAVVGRDDGEQTTDHFVLQLPLGLSAALGSVDLCPAARIATATCPDASQIGKAFVDVGSGPATAELAGGIYLTGPYRRGPFGVAMAFDAKVGPFDLGSFTVRGAMDIDSRTGQVSVRTDSMPRSFEGVPMRFQALRLEIDRPGFLRNPTSCGSKPVHTTVASSAGALAHSASEIFLRGCVDLPFRPAISLALTGPSQLHRRGKPGLQIAMQARNGDANLRSLDLAFPRALRFDAAGLREICARREALRDRCQVGARAGTGWARTPLLDTPLKGPVYVVQPEGNGQPDLWTSLRGGGLQLTLRGQSSSHDGQIETRFPQLPDMPLSKLTIGLAGGKRGVLSLSQEICAKDGAYRLFAPASLEGQNKAYREARVRVAAPGACGGG